MTDTRPVYQRWLKARGLGMAQLGAQDHRALAAIDACWGLYAVSSDEWDQARAIGAIRLLLPALHFDSWPLARELIARNVDEAVDRLWAEVLPSEEMIRSLKRWHSAHPQADE